jgi:hypothetical protein
MSDNTESLLSERDKIPIILREYDGLRNSVINRTNNGYVNFQIAAVLLALLTQRYHHRDFWPLVLLIIFTILIATWFVLRDIYKYSSRMKEIEADINKRAGEKLLVWESTCGATNLARWGLFRWLERHVPFSIR